MILRHALLGLLASAPMSGYDLLKAFDRTLGNAWGAQHNQIYTELVRLHQQGLIEVIEEGARRRKTYSLTEAGLAQLRGWLADTEPDRSSRNEATLRTFFLWLLDAPQATAFLEREAAAHRAVLEDFESRNRAGRGDSEVAFAAVLALEWGIRYERAYIEWAEWARRELTRRERRSGWGREWRRLRTRLGRLRRQSARS